MVYIAEIKVDNIVYIKVKIEMVRYTMGESAVSIDDVVCRDDDVLMDEDEIGWGGWR